MVETDYVETLIDLLLLGRGTILFLGVSPISRLSKWSCKLHDKLLCIAIFFYSVSVRLFNCSDTVLFSVTD